MIELINQIEQNKKQQQRIAKIIRRNMRILSQEYEHNIFL